MIARLMGLTTVSPDELERRLREGSATVFDVNAAESWRRARVPGARPLDPTGFAPTDLPANKDAFLVFYCSGPLCRKAPNAALRARRMAYTNVHVLSAGITGWIGAGMATESEESPASRKSW